MVVMAKRAKVGRATFLAYDHEMPEGETGREMPDDSTSSVYFYQSMKSEVDH